MTSGGGKRAGPLQIRRTKNQHNSVKRYNSLRCRYQNFNKYVNKEAS